MGGSSLSETDLWVQHLKEKRLSYGLSQNRLAVASGMTRQYLNDIENGRASPSDDMKTALLKALERLNPDAPLEMLFDYVRIRFPTTDARHVIEDILLLKMDYMLHEDYGLYSYMEHYALGDIFVMVSPDKQKGVLLELKGRGCRQFEGFLLAQHRSWFDFFMAAISEGGVFKRLDLAINDKVGILDIPQLTEKCRNEECISVFRSFKSYRSGELIRREEKEAMGHTLYIGSLKSEIYFCLYEKNYEQYVKNHVPIEEAEVKNRFEIRLKNERADHAIHDLMAYHDAERTAFSIINRYLRFVDKVENKRRNTWKMNENWAWFIGKNREKLKLTTQPEPYSFDRTLGWLQRQVAPTLKVALWLDQIKDTTVIDDMIRHAKLTKRHEKIVQQQVDAAEQMITNHHRQN
ncbi:replication initiation factor domain-containing protein [Sporolactobacillus shoreicorticis]|uniref:MobT family relaxase n=1 Tax=Sporolactobacillus shoreicorticis TaxID=1923877 RepID=A0ABW5S804_9BACL|nr:MobT family relaxase [Sporolactobacillus shoreicorticis]MCO7128370.1 replication initiation factor domain-containing protein [Sporolactobacillus shoreicorticis]